MKWWNWCIDFCIPLTFRYFFPFLQDDKNKLSIHGPQSCSNDMQESKKYELQSLNSQTTIDAFYVGSCWVWEKLTENSCHFILLAWKILHTKKICLLAQIWKDKSAQCNHKTNFSMHSSSGLSGLWHDISLKETCFIKCKINRLSFYSVHVFRLKQTFLMINKTKAMTSKIGDCNFKKMKSGTFLRRRSEKKVTFRVVLYSSGS